MIFMARMAYGTTLNGKLCEFFFQMFTIGLMSSIWMVFSLGMFLRPSMVRMNNCRKLLTSVLIL